MLPNISIVILSYSDNRLQTIRSLLASIERQSYDSIEVVYFIERSTRILKLVSEWKSKYPKKIYFTKSRMSVGESRNKAISIAAGDLVAFVDDDAELTLGWAEELASAIIHHPCAIGVTGKILPNWEVNNDSNLFPKSLYWMIGCTEWRDSSRAHYIESAQTLNSAYRREVFEQYKFQIQQYKNEETSSIHSGLQGDDVDFALRVTNGTGRKLLYDPQLVVMHKVPHSRTRVTYVAKYAFWQGFTEARYMNLKMSKERKNNALVPLLRKMMNDLVLESWYKLRLRATLFAALFWFTLGYVRYIVLFGCR